MNTKAAKTFWKIFNQLSPDLQELSKRKFDLWKQDPFHPSLNFKCVNPERNIWSVRINMNYRALGVRSDDDLIIWYWLGDHNDYLREIK